MIKEEYVWKNVEESLCVQFEVTLPAFSCKNLIIPRNTLVKTAHLGTEILSETSKMQSTATVYT
jgi:hypothetical protein